MTTNYKMTTKQYILFFGLAEAKPKDRNLEGFLEAFGAEFKERLILTEVACSRMGSDFTYQKFQHLVKEADVKVNSIINKIPHGIPEGFFGKFFATFVIPARAQYFPQINESISLKREQHIANEAKEAPDQSYGEDPE